MSTLPDNEFDLEKLFLPAWAQEPPSEKKYAKYEGGEERDERRGDRDRERRGPRPPRRDGPPGARRDQRGPRDDRRGPPRQDGGPGRPRGDRPHGDQPRFREEPRERREPPPPLPELNVSLVPDERGVESLARQIKMTGRAYPLFDIAQMILQKPERHMVAFSIVKDPTGQPRQKLFVCALDDTLWLSEDEAVAHILKKHFVTFYQAERTATEPPKGKYTFVAQCGMSGVVLGPPNHHDYQNQLRKLHTERFARMPFEVYKSRVRIVRDEEVVKKWVDDQSWRTEYICLNLPEPLRLGNMEAVEKHFRETHKENIIKPVEAHTLTGAASRNLRSPELTRLVRSIWEDQRRFPLQIATVLSQQFAGHGLQFFKVNKTVTHVSVARPHYLDLQATPVSEGVKRIVDYINANPKATRRKLMEVLALGPSVIPVAPAPAPARAEGSGATPVAAATAPEPTAEQTAIVADLHWLIHQGHVIEFANGTLETAKKPLPRPPKPEAKAVEKPAEAAPAAESAPMSEPAANAAAYESASESPVPVQIDSPTPPEAPGPDIPAPQAANEMPAPAAAAEGGFTTPTSPETPAASEALVEVAPAAVESQS